MYIKTKRGVIMLWLYIFIGYLILQALLMSIDNFRAGHNFGILGNLFVVVASPFLALFIIGTQETKLAKVEVLITSLINICAEQKNKLENKEPQ